MRKIPFSSFKKISEFSKNKKIVLFGGENIAEKTIRRIDKIDFIVDNSPNMWGAKRLGVNVYKPDILKEEKNIFVVICTTSFSEVSEQLEDMGLTIEKDFMVSPILNDLRIISELESINKRLLFTSGSPQQYSSEYGGGIYELVVDGYEWKYKKILSGVCYGLIHYGENIIAIDDNLGIVELDREYNIVRSKEFRKGSRCHGIAYSDITNCFYVVSSDFDQILVFDNNFNHISSISLSDKYEIQKVPCHHCNDLCVVGHSLYVSMFSFTGNWKQDIFDGVVLEIDITTNKIRNPIISNLWMPHNVAFLGGCLVVLESLRGHLRKHNAQVVGTFPGFTRGLDSDGEYFFIGQSRNRNYSKYIGLSKNISIDTSIIIFDEETKVSRSLQLPSKLSEIHSILLLE